MKRDEIQDEIIKALYKASEKGQKDFDLRGFAANSGWDFPTEVIPVAKELDDNGLIDPTAVDYHLIVLTEKGQRYVDSMYGIPMWYTEPIEDKSEKKLQSMLTDINQRIGQVGIGGRPYGLAKEKQQQITWEIERRDKKKISKRNKIFLSIGILGAILTVLNILRFFNIV